MSEADANVDDRRRGSGLLDHAARACGRPSSRYAAVLVLLVGIFVVLSLTQANFFTRANIENLLTSVSILFVVSMGMTFVVLTAGIDLSVGSTARAVGHHPLPAVQQRRAAGVARGAS